MDRPTVKYIKGYWVTTWPSGENMRWNTFDSAIVAAMYYWTRS